jgi:hypothetical protein
MRAGASGVRLELTDDACLADARLADEHHHAAAAG